MGSENRDDEREVNDGAEDCRFSGVMKIEDETSLSSKDTEEEDEDDEREETGVENWDEEVASNEIMDEESEEDKVEEDNGVVVVEDVGVNEADIGRKW